jgi:hypothetical protein
MASKNLCKGKSVKNPNRCKKISGCKVAKGTKRTFCRKKHNKSKKAKTMKKSQKKRKTMRRSEISNLKGYNKKQQRALAKLR